MSKVPPGGVPVGFAAGRFHNVGATREGESLGSTLPWFSAKVEVFFSDDAS